MKFRSERDSLVEVLSTAAAPSEAAVRRRLCCPGCCSVQGNRLVGDRNRPRSHDPDGPRGDRSGGRTCVVPARLAADIVRSLEAGRGDRRGEGGEGRDFGGPFALRAADVPRRGVPGGYRREASDSHPIGAALAEALRQVVRAASSDDARPLLTGVLMTTEQGTVRLVATDSYRLALRDLRGHQGPPGDRGHPGPRPRPGRAAATVCSGARARDSSGVSVRAGAHEVTFTRRLGSRSRPGCSTARIPTTAS